MTTSFGILAFDMSRGTRPPTLPMSSRMHHFPNSDANGLEIARRLRANFPQVKIIVISQHDPAALTAQAIDAGVNGCLDKGRLGMDLVATIQALE